MSCGNRRPRVAIVGLGGLGCPAALALAATGFVDLVLIDDDRVEAANLHRQVLHRTADVGRLKVESARDALSARTPARIEAHALRFDARTAPALLARADLVIDGTDRYETKFTLHDAALAAGVSLVHGGAVRWLGQVLAVRASPGDPCLRCVFPSPPAAASALGCAEQGVAGPLVGVVGALQAEAALALLDGSQRPGELVAVDGLAGTRRTLRFARDPECPAPHHAAARLAPVRAPLRPHIEESA